MKDDLEGRIRLGRFELDLHSGELRPIGVEDDRQKILLREQPFQVLRMLIASPGKIVTREAIKKKLWTNDTIVDFDHSINVAIRILRLAKDPDGNIDAVVEIYDRVVRPEFLLDRLASHDL